MGSRVENPSDVSNGSVADKPQVAEFVSYYAENNSDIAAAAQYIPLNEEQATALSDAVSSIG